MMTETWPTGLSASDLAAELNRAFANTLMDSLKIRLLEASADKVVAEMPVSEEIYGVMGAVHAGAMVSLADTAATFAVIVAKEDSSPEHFPLAIGLSTQIVGNVREGTLRAESVVVHPGRTIVAVDTHVTDEAGRLLAKVTTTHFIRN